MTMTHLQQVLNWWWWCSYIIPANVYA